MSTPPPRGIGVGQADVHARGRCARPSNSRAWPVSPTRCSSRPRPENSSNAPASGSQAPTKPHSCASPEASTKGRARPRVPVAPVGQPGRPLQAFLVPLIPQVAGRLSRRPWQRRDPLQDRQRRQAVGVCHAWHKVVDGGQHQSPQVYEHLIDSLPASSERTSLVEDFVEVRRAQSGSFPSAALVRPTLK